jgi:hypothetical protein
MAESFARASGRVPVVILPERSRRSSRGRALCCGYGETVQHARDLDAAFDRAAESDTSALCDVLTDPGSHPPIARYDGTLDQLENGRVIQNPVP